MNAPSERVHLDSEAGRASAVRRTKALLAQGADVYVAFIPLRPTADAEAAMRAHGTPCWPFAGTTCWRGEVAVGRWGTGECPLRLHVQMPEGTIRPATRAERKLFDRLYGTEKHADELRRHGITVVP
ncbi:MAG: hypothetical protein FJX68_06855 [Alphaproteobacteria bacterium]|nr:hypothetical protein [Alphaproteobacteria bacterium]